MNKKELENILEMVQEEEKREEIIDTIIAATQEAEGAMSGWGVDVCIDTDGMVSTTGLMSQNTQTYGQWEGSTYTICTCKSWTLADYEFDYIEDAKSFEAFGEIKAAFKKHWAEDYGEAIEDDDFRRRYAEFESFVKENYSEIADQIEEFNRDWVYGALPEEADNKYDWFINRLREDIATMSDYE